ncbi:unnamed protein product [Effrenium voratum]|nr:unnamed protein product [Effrenium voratum]
MPSRPTAAVACPCPGRHVFCSDCLSASKALCCPLCRNRSEPVVRFLFALQRPGEGQMEWMIDQLLDSALQGNTQILQILVDWNCPVNLADRELQPLHLAAQEGHTAIARILVEANAQVEELELIEGATPLSLAAFEGHLETVRYLVEVKARLDHFDGDRLTPFMAACSGGHVEVAQFLLQANSDPQKRSFLKFTALHIAVEDMCTEVCRWLLQEAKGVVVNALAQYEESILHVAGRVDHWEVVDMMQTPFGQALVEARTTTGFGALHLAAALGNLQAADSLLRLRADIDARSAQEVSALYAATENGHLGVVKLLLFLGANCRVPCRIFPAHHSLLDWHLPRDSTNLLNLQVGCPVSFNLASLELEERPKASHWVTGLVEAIEQDPNSADRLDDLVMVNTGDLTYCICRYNCMPHLPSTLLENRHVLRLGEAVYIKAPIYCTSGDWILVPGDVGHVVAFAHGGEYEIEAEDGRCRYLAAREDLIPFLQEEALNCAARRGHLEILRELLQARADLEAGPRTALHCATEGGHLEVVQALLGARADLDAQWLASNSAIETAALAGQQEILAYLLDQVSFSRRPLQCLAEALAAARAAGLPGQLILAKLLALHGAGCALGSCEDLWLERQCLVQLRDLGMECLLSGDEASAMGISDFLGCARCAADR